MSITKKAPKAPTTTTTIPPIIPMNVQHAVNRPPTATRYVTPGEMIAEDSPMPDVLRGQTPPELPADLATALEWWKFCQQPWHDARLAVEWRVWIRKLRERAFSLQQVRPAPACAGIFTVAIGTSEARRLKEAEELQAALDCAFDGIPLAPAREVAAPLLDFVASNDFLEVARPLRNALAKYAIRRNELFNLVSPQRRSEERRLALNSRPSPEASKRIAEEEALAANPVFPQLCSNARRELSELHRTTIRPLEIQLVELAIQFVTGCRAAALDSERAFFGAVEMPHEATAFSKRYDTALTELQRQLGLLKGNAVAMPIVGGPGAVPSASNGILETVFGCPII
jgi:hypothetical protein